MQSTSPHATTTTNKDHLSKLPPEILHQILLLLTFPLPNQGLNHRIALFPLLPLLCVSKHLAHVALPLIYDSPYFRPYRPNRAPPQLDEGFENPTRQLLQRNSKARECKVLDLVYRLSKDANDATNPDAINPNTDGEAISALDYTAHIRIIDPTGFWTVFLEHQISPRVVEYLRRQEEEEEERVMGVELDQFPPGYLERFKNKWDFVLRCFQVDLHRHVIWHVAEPILEQLRGLSIPISDVDRYREMVGRFESLEQVSFILDEAFDFDANRFSHRPMHPEWVGIWKKGRESQGKVGRQWTGKERKEEAMRKMIEFVKEHSLLFRGRLTKAMCKDGWFWPDTQQSYPEDIQIEMLTSIPPAPKLKSLSRREWLLVKAHPETIDFSWVESIDQSWFEEPVCKGLPNDWVLPRCRRLKCLSTRPFGPDSFKWAVQERRDLDSLVSCSTTTARSRYRIVLDRELLLHCPNITSIYINDGTREYDFSEIVPCLPAYLPRLLDLDLWGWSALTFDPETLSLTPGLSSLTCTIGGTSLNQNSVFIPPVTELYRSFGLLGETEEEVVEVEETGGRIVRPRWTWDWYLPMLVGLCFSGEFAYLFRFRMLTGCPQLKHLTLDIRTNDYNGPPRFITEADLFIAGAGETRERIVAERLTELSLRGIWVVESETTLSRFLVDMFPSLNELETRGGSNGGGVFSSFSLGSMMSIIRNNPNHKWQEVHTGLMEPRRQEALGYGLCHPEWEADTLDFETAEMLGIKILFKGGNEDEYEDNDFYRVLKVLDFERDVSWAIRDDYLPNSSIPLQVPWVF
ncbi:hypothetical protein BGX24_010322 [Mortierella sp. AD032]|nr:hypothetical protein BGX24_010322 [Mortierella sp. AD032]